MSEAEEGSRNEGECRRELRKEKDLWAHERNRQRVVGASGLMRSWRGTLV